MASEKDWADVKAGEIVMSCGRVPVSNPEDLTLWDKRLAKAIADALRAERALYEKANAECRWWRSHYAYQAIDNRWIADGVGVDAADAHDAARKEAGLG